MRGIKETKLAYSTKLSAGLDLRANKEVLLEPGQIAVVPTGETINIAEAVGPQYFGMVCSRSGLAAQYGVIVLNAPGIIDPDYTGELKVILHNVTKNSYLVEKGDRIAQLVVAPYTHVYGLPVDPAVRGDGGLGSTGR